MSRSQFVTWFHLAPVSSAKLSASSRLSQLMTRFQLAAIRFTNPQVVDSKD
jgi:hypothetical protein